MPHPKPPAPRVLIVDASEESRLVLGELLGRTGVETVATGFVATACGKLRQEPITAGVVIDTDALTPTELRRLTAEATRSGAPIVLVGTNRPESALGGATFLRKPYHYRELVHKIGMSLGGVVGQARAAA